MEAGTEIVMKNNNHRSTRRSSKSAETSSRWNDWFRGFAHKASEAVGSVAAFIAALSLILVWSILGPVFGFSDTWQLVINTATTIVTFVMVFLIQNTQNRDAKAIHLKLDELILRIKGARNSLIALEDLSDEELADLQKQFEKVRRRANGEGEGEAASQAKKAR